jgi:serine/threonine protein phosphatase PrpC
LLSIGGLLDTVSYKEIELIMREGSDPEETANRLFSNANG